MTERCLPRAVHQAMPVAREVAVEVAKQYGVCIRPIPSSGSTSTRAAGRSWTSPAWQDRLSGLHFHDLRHTGNTIAASSGASLKDLMQRMGHDSVRAALICQHSTAETDRKIADAMKSKIAQNIVDGSSGRPSGAG
ncbi:hypothetical protein ACWDLG_33885 [Nonomuraea sp. NPDC003727]